VKISFVAKETTRGAADWPIDDRAKAHRADDQHHGEGVQQSSEAPLSQEVRCPGLRSLYFDPAQWVIDEKGFHPKKPIEWGLP
jgi:hypothetical protein